MSVYSHSRSIRDLNVPFNGNVFDYLDEDFASDTVSSTTTARTVTTKKRILVVDTSASSTSPSNGVDVPTSAPSTPASSPSTTTEASTLSSTTTDASENVIVRVFHSNIPIDIANQREGFEPTSAASSAEKFSAALNELKLLSRKQSVEIGKLRMDVARINERWTDEISALREDVNGLVKALPPFDKHLRFVSTIISSEPKHDVNNVTSSSDDEITASDSKNVTSSFDDEITASESKSR